MHLVVVGTLNDEMFSEPLKILKKNLRLDSGYDMADYTKYREIEGGKSKIEVLDYILTSYNLYSSHRIDFPAAG